MRSTHAVATAGIDSFVSWYADPQHSQRSATEVFAAAPPELTRSVSLQHTLSIVRTVVRVVEEHAGNPTSSPAVDLDVDQVLAADAWARRRATERIGALAHQTQEAAR